MWFLFRSDRSPRCRHLGVGCVVRVVGQAHFDARAGSRPRQFRFSAVAQGPGSGAAPSISSDPGITRDGPPHGQQSGGDVAVRRLDRNMSVDVNNTVDPAGSAAGIGVGECTRLGGLEDRESRQRTRYAGGHLVSVHTEHLCRRNAVDAEPKSIV